MKCDKGSGNTAVHAQNCTGVASYAFHANRNGSQLNPDSPCRTDFTKNQTVSGLCLWHILFLVLYFALLFHGTILMTQSTAVNCWSIICI
jgi:hypothetical protein